MGEENEDKLTGILSDGYSYLPNSIMRCKDISIEAKAVYGYLRGYKGSSEYAYPSRSWMAYQLNISQNSLTKYIKELINKGLIYKQQGRTVGNKYDNNRYYFNDDLVLNNQSTQNSITQNLTYSFEENSIMENLGNGNSVSGQMLSNNNKENNNNINKNNTLNNNNINNNSILKENSESAPSLQEFKFMITKYIKDNYLLDTFNEFLEMKQQSDKPFKSERELKALVDRLDQLKRDEDKKDCLLYSISNSYPDIYPDRYKDKDKITRAEQEHNTWLNEYMKDMKVE